MDNFEKYTSIVETSMSGIVTADNIITAIYQRHISKYSVADKYLQDIILDKGKPSQDDMEIAARLYAIPQMRKHYKNIANILVKSDQLYEKWMSQNGKVSENINEDWMNYFLDRAKLVSDENIQLLWACILTQECFDEGTFRKVMLDRLALLDRKSAILFQILCSLTYAIDVSDDRRYSIPLYLRNDKLYEMVKNENICFSEEDAIHYQNHFSVENRVLSGIELEDELEILQEIGLISLSTETDEGDVYSINEVEFTIMTENAQFKVPPRYDEHQGIYYIATGCVTFTRMGLELYNALKKQIKSPDFFFNLVHAFMDYQELEETDIE